MTRRHTDEEILDEMRALCATGAPATFQPLARVCGVPARAFLNDLLYVSSRTAAAIVRALTQALADYDEYRRQYKRRRAFWSRKKIERALKLARLLEIEEVLAQQQQARDPHWEAVARAFQTTSISIVRGFNGYFNG